jgi:hypothetical protein
MRFRKGQAVVVGGALLSLLVCAQAFSSGRAAEKPVISGTTEVGEVLSSSPAGDSAVYKWERCDPAVASCTGSPPSDTGWTHIEGANDQSYTLTEADRGRYIRVRAKGTSIGESFAASAPVGPVSVRVPATASAQSQAPEPHHGTDFLIDSDGSGSVQIKLPGTRKFAPVESLREVPFGSIVKAQGVATIVSERGDGADETARFWGGTFKALQSPDADSYFVSKLRSKLHCAGNKSASKASASGPIARAASGRGRLWGSGHGRYRSRGRGGAATVRGTTWWTQDRCGGTAFGVTEGTGIDVRDPGHKGLIFLQPGDTYFAEI